MGSTNTRKKNDRVRINTPQSGSGSGGLTGEQRDVNVVCPMAFDVLIESKVTVPDGINVTVRGSELFIFGKEAGKISPRNLKTLVECARHDITYLARVINSPGGKIYARFEQRA